MTFSRKDVPCARWNTMSFEFIKKLPTPQEIREKYPTKTIWMYTGDSWEDIYDLPIMQYVDVVVDGEFHVEEKDVKLLWKGSKNQRVIDVKKTLASDHRRVPVLHCGDYA